MTEDKHPRDGGRGDYDDEQPSERIEIRPRAGQHRQREQDHAQRYEGDRIVHPVDRPENHEQREDLDRRMQPMNEARAVDVAINRHQAWRWTQFTNSSTLSVLAPKRRPSAATSGGLNDALSSISSCAKNSRTGPSKSFLPRRIRTTRRAYSATSHGVCVIITIAIPERLRSAIRLIIRRCSR